MMRLISTVIICLLLGSALGWVNHRMSYDGYTERFSGSRVTSGNSSASLSATETIDDAAPEKVPKIEVQGGTTFDFGSMTQGATKNHTFIVKNIGNAPLKLDVASSTCRCTIGTLEKSTLEPGEETGIKLEWTASGVLDEFGQSATIKTNDPEHTDLLLNIKGLVARTIVFEPGDVNLGEISATGTLEKKLMMFSYSERPLTILEVRWGDDKTADRVSIVNKPIEFDPKAFPRHNAAKEAAEITLTIKPGLPLGPINSRLRVLTDDPNLTDLEVNVTGKVAGDIQLIAGPSFNADNNILNIGKVDRKVGTTMKIHLAVQGSEQDSIVPAIESVVPSESINVTIGQPMERGSRRLYPIICEVPEGAPPANYPGTNSTNYGKIVIKTNHPHLSQIPIYMRLVVQ